MKKIFLFAALVAALTMNATVIDVDLSKAAPIAYGDCSATPQLADNVLTVDYSAGAWLWAGVEIPLDNLDVKSVDFEYKGVTASWTGFVVYLRAEDGARWFDESDDFSMDQEDWFAKTGYVPTQLMWDESEFKFGEKPFIALGFIANPMEATNGSFALRNVKLTVEGEVSAINNPAAAVKTVKVIRDGQMVILRDGRTFNALGAQIQ